ncbi:MAG: hypothetical protein Q4D87_09020 [Actinomycetaceae bacterium]|nr:hypothetical protein [Actinomycetaceae bacterium]
MITVRDLVVQVRGLASRLDALPQFRWGRVESVDPLAVVLDAESTPLTGVGTVVVPVLGARVLVLLWNRRATVLGVARPQPEEPATENTIVVGGVEYQASGVQSVPSFTWTYSQHPVYVTTITFPFPYTPPAGWGFHYYSRASSGFTFTDVAGVNWANRATAIRTVQFFNNDLKAFRKAGWQLVKIQ